MTSVPKWLRDRIIERAQGLCEYCQTPQMIVIEMEIDQIVPERAGGRTTEQNLCLSCISCNSHKQAFQTAVDPETGESVSLFNPRTQTWYEHFQWGGSGSSLIGITPTGRATIERFKINREIAIRARERWVAAGWHPPQ